MNPSILRIGEVCLTLKDGGALILLESPGGGGASLRPVVLRMLGLLYLANYPGIAPGSRRRP